MPTKLTTASTALQTSTESDQMRNVPSVKVSEKLDTSEIDNTEIATQIVKPQGLAIGQAENFTKEIKLKVIII
jgi:hypothetical protein